VNASLVNGFGRPVDPSPHPEQHERGPPVAAGRHVAARRYFSAGQDVPAIELGSRMSNKRKEEGMFHEFPDHRQGAHLHLTMSADDRAADGQFLADATFFDAHADSRRERGGEIGWCFKADNPHRPEARGRSRRWQDEPEEERIELPSIPCPECGSLMTVEGVRTDTDRTLSSECPSCGRSLSFSGPVDQIAAVLASISGKDPAPIEVELEREDADRILDALMSGGAISPPEGRAWRPTDMLSLAGACIFGAGSLGPAVPPPEMSEEGRPAASDEQMAILTAAAEFLAHVFYRVAHKNWDEEFEDRMAALVFSNRMVVPTEGWRKGVGEWNG
jgi:predicted RNA-binding Zn-ribbon protein involved in translation (DUF1610 family)